MAREVASAAYARQRQYCTAEDVSTTKLEQSVRDQYGRMRLQKVVRVLHISSKLNSWNARLRSTVPLPY